MSVQAPIVCARCGKSAAGMGGLKNHQGGFACQTFWLKGLGLVPQTARDGVGFPRWFELAKKVCVRTAAPPEVLERFVQTVVADPSVGAAVEAAYALNGLPSVLAVVWPLKEREAMRAAARSTTREAEVRARLADAERELKRLTNRIDHYKRVLRGFETARRRSHDRDDAV